MCSLVEESPSLARFVANCSTKADLQIAIKHIQNVSEEIHKNREEIGKLVSKQTRMEQQLLGAVNNVKAQLHCLMQSLPPAQWHRVLEIDGIDSVYEMCQRSPKISKGDHKSQGEIAEPMAPVAATMRRHSMPATLGCVTEEHKHLIKQVRQHTASAVGNEQQMGTYVCM